MVYRTAHTLHSTDNRIEEGKQSSIVYTIQAVGVIMLLFSKQLQKEGRGEAALVEMSDLSFSFHHC